MADLCCLPCANSCSTSGQPLRASLDCYTVATVLVSTLRLILLKLPSMGLAAEFSLVCSGNCVPWHYLLLCLRACGAFMITIISKPYSRCERQCHQLQQLRCQRRDAGHTKQVRTEAYVLTKIVRARMHALVVCAADKTDWSVRTCLERKL